MSELNDLRATVNEATGALAAMVREFAPKTVVDGREMMTTGGVAALIAAFDALGYDDPCEIEP